MTVANLIRLRPDAKIEYSIPGAVGADIFCIEEAQTSMLQPNLLVYRTGLAIEAPEGMFFALVSRSSIRDRGLVLANGLGVIEPNYQGEIQVSFLIVSPNTYRVYLPGERMAQLICLPYGTVQFNEVDRFHNLSARGTGGHGSTGL